MNIDAETSKDQVIEFLLNIQNGKEELLGESPFMRAINDMFSAFIELFTRQPIMAGMISKTIKKFNTLIKSLSRSTNRPCLVCDLGSVLGTGS